MWLVGFSWRLKEFSWVHQSSPLTCPLVSVDSGAEEDQVGSQHCLDQREGDGSCLVDDKQLSLSQFGMMLGLDVLDGL